jgi:hypothetical protein
MSKKSKAILHVQIFLIIMGAVIFFIIGVIIWTIMLNLEYADFGEMFWSVFCIILLNLVEFGLFWYYFSLKKYTGMQEYWQEVHLEGQLSPIFKAIKGWLAAHHFKIKKEIPLIFLKSYTGLSNLDRNNQWWRYSDDIYARRWLEIHLQAEKNTVSISLYETVGTLGLIRSPLIQKEVLSLTQHLQAHFPEISATDL